MILAGILAGAAVAGPSIAIAQGAADGKGASVPQGQPRDRVLALVRAQATNGSLPVRIWSRIGDGVYRSGLKRGVPTNVMAAFVRVLSFAVDFERDLRPNDFFELAYIDAPGSGRGAGKRGILLFAHVSFGARSLSVWRFRPEDAKTEFFSLNGASIRKGLLRTPVDRARVSSRFGMRKHPILGYESLHQGLDFAASIGTPVYAAGDGVVEVARWFGSFGRYVRIRHGDGLVTAYAHMSSIERGIRPGVRVRQGQAIGKVGATGRTTGPHLHYETHLDDKPVDPASLKLASRRSLAGDELIAFKWYAALLSLNPTVSPLGKGTR